MANRLADDNEELAPRERYGSFIERFPDYPSWLDGGTWELDLAEDLGDPDAKQLNAFRSTLHYQARELGLKLATKTLTRLEPDGLHRRLLVRAY